MITHDEPSRELGRAVSHAGAAWREHDRRIPEQGPERRAVRIALMDARRAGASWRILGKELGMEPTAVREQAGCMPRYGERPAPEERRQGRGAGHPGRHECKDPESHEHRGCGGTNKATAMSFQVPSEAFDAVWSKDPDGNFINVDGTTAV